MVSKSVLSSVATELASVAARPVEGALGCLEGSGVGGAAALLGRGAVRGVGLVSRAGEVFAAAGRRGVVRRVRGRRCCAGSELNVSETTRNNAARRTAFLKNFVLMLFRLRFGGAKCLLNDLTQNAARKARRRAQAHAIMTGSAVL